MKGKILIIDDEEKLRKLLSRIIQLEGYEVLQAQNIQKGLQILENEADTQLVLTDVKLPDGNGIELLEKIKRKYPLCEVIVMTAYGTIHDGVKAMKLGAFDYITKGDGDDELLIVVERAFEKAQMQQKIKHLEQKIEQKFSFDNILGKRILPTIQLAQRVSATDSTVLIEGESGTGKELFAQAIHQASARKNKNFVAVNCSAFPKDLLESEMFGHKKGAFTGAIFDKKGLFEEANGGTLFLDEIGEMNLDLQAKLLRVLESQSFTKIGETKTTQVSVRILAATNRNLLKESEKMNFREDLYYRLAVFKLYIPPLRERKEDIEILTKYYMKHFSVKMQKRVDQLDKNCLAILKNHFWKGNIRELKNIIERAVILADSETLIPDLLPPDFLQQADIQTDSYLLENIEKKHILKMLNICEGNKTKAAELMGIGLTTLYRKMAEYGIEK